MSRAQDLIVHAVSTELALTVSVASGSRHARRLLEANARYASLLDALAWDDRSGAVVATAVQQVADGTLDAFDADVTLLALFCALLRLAPQLLTTALVGHAAGAMGPYTLGLLAGWPRVTADSVASGSGVVWSSLRDIASDASSSGSATMGEAA